MLGDGPIEMRLPRSFRLECIEDSIRIALFLKRIPRDRSRLFLCQWQAQISETLLTLMLYPVWL